MKTAGLICEFNPFHNGHAYIMEEIKRQTGSDFLIAVMSGNFVQRGEPAVFDKYVRAEMALRAGADLVLELPPLFASSSAREFATAGVLTAAKTGVVDVIGFGAELSSSVTEYESFHRAAALLSEEPALFKEQLKASLKEGSTYPKARMEALSACGIADTSVAESPNNILALEYLRALKQYEKAETKGIGHLFIKRLGDGYNKETVTDSPFASATALRGILKNAGLSPQSMTLLKKYCPASVLPVYQKLSKERFSLIFPDMLSTVLNYRILELSAAQPSAYAGISSESASPKKAASESCFQENGVFHTSDIAETKENPFWAYADMSPEMAERLLNRGGNIQSFTGRVLDLKTKQYTYSRCSRALLHLALGITEAETEAEKAKGYCSYLRILGFKKSAQPLLKEIKKKASVPLVTKAADFKELCERDVHFDNLYYALSAISAVPGKNEYERQIIILP